MLKTVSYGEAFRDGRRVANEIAVVESTVQRNTPVHLAGGRTGYRTDTIRHPSGIKFETIDDAALETELMELIAAACDRDIARRHRDSGWSVRPIDLVLEGERNLIGCTLSPPFEAVPVAPRATTFPIRHADLYPARRIGGTTVVRS